MPKSYKLYLSCAIFSIEHWSRKLDIGDPQNCRGCMWHRH